MKQIELLNEVQNEMPRFTAAVRDAIQPLTDEQFNQSVGGGWSPAQVVQHLILGNGPYTAKIAKAIEEGKRGADLEVKHTWVGKMIAKIAGPGGNAPTPAVMIPAATTYGKEVVNEWAKQNERIVELAKSANGIDLSKAMYKNPFIKFVQMNLCDAFAIVLAHTDRHVRQIVERAAIIRGEKN